MKILVKDSEDNVMELISVNGFVPPGFTLVAEENIAEEELALARKFKMNKIRAQRDRFLVQNDKEWLIASKKSESTVDLEADAQILRDLPEAAETVLDAMTVVEDIEAHDAFAELELSRSYE